MNSWLLYPCLCFLRPYGSQSTSSTVQQPIWTVAEEKRILFSPSQTQNEVENVFTY